MEIYRKTRDTAVGLMGQVINNLCESNGETFGTILKERVSGLGAREAVISTFDNMVQVHCKGSPCYFHLAGLPEKSCEIE